MRNNMLIGRDNHYYVRRGSMESEYDVAFGRALDQATNDISDVLWPNGEPGEWTRMREMMEATRRRVEMK